MSWDDKDWFDITFYEGDKENIKKASFEYDAKERDYDNIRNEISITYNGWDLQPLDNFELIRLQSIAKKYFIFIRYIWNGKFLYFTPDTDYGTNTKYSF